MNKSVAVDYKNWDWLPEAATEIELYLGRLLAEAAINPHDVSARAKSITSFESKCLAKEYWDPLQQVTDTVAVRIITYSVTDRQRAQEVIQGRFNVKESLVPGDTKPANLRGYDCLHLVVDGEAVDSGWVVVGGELSRYFTKFGGLEIQIRTVAAHAWAEFEHARRYKGQSYLAVNEQDQDTVDLLFGAASDARRALDQVFVAIDRVLANPTESTPPSAEIDDGVDGDPADVDADEHVEKMVETPIDVAALQVYLEKRFPEDEDATEKGVEFACELVAACDLLSIESLSAALDEIDGEQVRSLMDISTPVTKVRRLDDELLARFGQSYISDTGGRGDVKNRGQQLEWRYDRVRNKVRGAGYLTYVLTGEDCPDELRKDARSAVGTVREVARIVARNKGIEAVLIGDQIDTSAGNLSSSTRAKEVAMEDLPSLWVASNLTRQASEMLLIDLLDRAAGMDLRVVKDGRTVASTP